MPSVSNLTLLVADVIMLVISKIAHSVKKKPSFPQTYLKIFEKNWKMWIVAIKMMPDSLCMCAVNTTYVILSDFSNMW